METKHTPTPWTRIERSVHAPQVVVADCATYAEVSPEEAGANAQFIVRAVNSHDALLAACKAVLRAQRAGELSYKSSDRCGYEAMLEVESAISLAESSL